MNFADKKKTILGEDFFEGIERHKEKMRAAFEKLAADPCKKNAEIGDRVLVSAGPIGKGFEWERLEAKVLDIADTAYKLQFIEQDPHRDPHVGWVHRCLVTDVLAKRTEGEA